MPAEPSHLDRLVAALAYEYQRERLNTAPLHKGRRRNPPIPYVDLGQYAHLSDLQAARALGCQGSWAEHVADWVADERAGLLDRPDRCQAGSKQRHGMRCHWPAMPGERWCGHHHPEPPDPPLPPKRVSVWDLKTRPDGDLLTAVYAVTDRMERLESSVAAALDRLQWEQDYARANGPSVLNAAQAAEMLGISRGHLYRLCKQHRVPFSRLGRLYKFSPSELQGWLASKTLPPVR